MGKPDYKKEELSLGDSITVDKEGLVIKIVRKSKESSVYLITLQSESIGLKASFEFDYKSGPGLFCSLPMNNEGTTYLATVKKGPLVVKGEYSYEGKEYSCSVADRDCLLSFDLARGQ